VAPRGPVCGFVAGIVQDPHDISSVHRGVRGVQEALPSRCRGHDTYRESRLGTHSVCGFLGKRKGLAAGASANPSFMVAGARVAIESEPAKTPRSQAPRPCPWPPAFAGGHPIDNQGHQRRIERGAPGSDQDGSDSEADRHRRRNQHAEISKTVPAFADVSRGGSPPQRGVRFRNDIVTGPGESEILLEDPSGNPIELFLPGRTA
jgi:hypothetical protein